MEENEKKNLSWIEEDASEIAYDVMDANVPVDKGYFSTLSVEEIIKWGADQAMTISPEASDAVIRQAAIYICNSIRKALSEESEQ